MKVSKKLYRKHLEISIMGSIQCLICLKEMGRSLKNLNYSQRIMFKTIFILLKLYHMLSWIILTKRKIIATHIL